MSISDHRSFISTLFKRALRLGVLLQHDERGNTSIMMGLAAIPLITVAGAAIDYNRALDVETRLQAIADTAALAGASRSGGDDGQISAALSFLTAQDIENYSLTYSPEVTAPDNSVKVTLIGDLKGTFMPVAMALAKRNGDLPTGDMRVRVDATARFTDVAGGMVCILTLNKTAQNAMYFSGSGNITASGCGFQSNSNHASQALHLQGSAVATADFFKSVGGWDITGNRASFSTAPEAGAAEFEEPFKFNVNCPGGVGSDITVGGRSAAAATSLSESVYRNITVRNNRYGTFTPGIHYVKGEISLTGGLLAGTGVTIVLCGPNAKINMNGGALALEAPQTGTYAGFAIVADEYATAENQLQGNAQTYIRGIMYTPKSGTVITGNSDFNLNSAYFPIINDYITITGSGRVNIGMDWSAYGFTKPTELEIAPSRTVWLDQ